MKQYMSLASQILLLLFSIHSIANTTVKGSERRFEKTGVNKIMPVVLSFPFLPHALTHGYDHSVNKGFRAFSDCQPECPKIDVWKYLYSPKGEIIDSEKPISTLKEHWKSPHEARIISVSLFGQDPQYLDGIVDFIDSFSHIKHVNNIDEDVWGYETFTVRVYTPKRSPKENRFSNEFENAIPQETIEKLLELGAEIAFVDNHLEEVGKDATFWRFLVIGEEMPKGETLRYLSRDTDWKLSAGETYAVAEWIASGLSFHRMQLGPACMSPLMAHIFGGKHTGPSPLVKDIKTMMEYFPYRFAYGDDELFLRDMVWPKAKYNGSVMTHIGDRGWISWFAEPYASSCQEPTQVFCDQMRPGTVCEDRTLPDNIVFPFYQIELDWTLEKIKKELPESFDLRLDTDQGEMVKQAFTASGPQEAF